MADRDRLRTTQVSINQVRVRLGGAASGRSGAAAGAAECEAVARAVGERLARLQPGRPIELGAVHVRVPAGQADLAAAAAEAVVRALERLHG
jgi:hypothetical protein